MLLRILLFFLIAFALATLLGFAGGSWWLLDLFAHFRVTYAVGLGALALIALGLRRWAIAGAAVFFAVVNLAVVAPVWLARRGSFEASWPKLRLLVANVYTANREPGRLLTLIDQERPDVIALLETDERWMAALAPLREGYPHVLAEPREDNFGLVILSRVPLGDPRVLDFGDTGLPSLRVDLDVGSPLELVLVHAMPPVSAGAAARRDRQLGALGRELHRPRSLLCGDLNASPWSAAFRDLLGASGLRDSRRGFGVQGTWPAGRGPFAIPIDHCLVGSGVIVEDRRLGPDIGSDHLPFVLDLRLPPDRLESPPAVHP